MSCWIILPYCIYRTVGLFCWQLCACIANFLHRVHGWIILPRHYRGTTGGYLLEASEKL